MSTAAVPTNKFSWLLKREFWEYRGAFFWTPAIVAMVMLGFILLALVIAEMSANRAGVNLNGMNLNEITRHLSDGNVAQLHAGLDIGMLGLGFPICIALFFVLFSYGVGALYNDRADRSVLFWKSLPISDTETVLAKVVAMALIAPVLAVGAMIALHLGFLVVMSVWVLVHGVNPLLLWAPSHLIVLWTKLILLIPVNALWALPSIGWLLLVSSFVRTKPFMWAFLLPVTAGVLTSVIHLMNSLSLPSGWFWKNIVGRLLFSLVPGSWLDASNLKDFDRDDRLPEALANLLSFDSVGHLLSTPNFLIGVAAGVAMIAGAVYFRRQRTESYA
jgi:ABC-2 type transport system permease protein